MLVSHLYDTSSYHGVGYPYSWECDHNVMIQIYGSVNQMTSDYQCRSVLNSNASALEAPQLGYFMRYSTAILSVSIRISAICTEFRCFANGGFGIGLLYDIFYGHSCREHSDSRPAQDPPLLANEIIGCESFPYII